MTKQVQELDHVIIRFAGDSGDGMQLTGDRFTQETAVFGNDLSTLPNFPAEIRAPAGTLPGVSSFQLHFADHDILTPGDAPDVLVAMNPAALKANLKDLPRGTDLIINTDEFTKRNLQKVGYEKNPLEDGSLSAWHLHAVPLTSLTVKALEDQAISRKDAERAKNMFALGMLSWLYGRGAEGTLSFLEQKFGKKPEIYKANVTAFQAGWNFGETTEAFSVRYEVKPAALKPGRYRNITGNSALAVTTTSGPGMLLKAETVGLAVSVELPMLIIDVQRAGPSTGMPTKTEQADLLMAMYGRNGESPVPIVAAMSPSDCFHAAIEAARIALTYRTPVILLSDGYLANGSEPWLIPEVASLPDLSAAFEFATVETHVNGDGEFQPFKRDPQTLARPWAIPGTAGLEHRIGGIEKADGTGAISYDPDNHDLMVRARQAKVDGITVPDLEVDDPDGDAKVLVLGWGLTYGSIGAAVRRTRKAGLKVAQAHLRHMNPFPANLGEVLHRYDKVLVPEINLGQLALLLRGKYLVDVISYNRVRGLPFQAAELASVIEEVIGNA